jgi:hypothetical protein
MRPAGLFIVLLFPFFFSCQKKNCCDDVKLGDVYTHDTNWTWIPFTDGHKQLSFLRSGDSAEATYIARGFEERESRFDKAIESDCTPYCHNYYTTHQRHLVFEEQDPSNILRVIGYVIDKNLPKDMPDNLDPDTIKDMLSLVIDNNTWDIPIGDTATIRSEYQAQELLDSFAWHGYIYRDVYHIQTKPDHQLPNAPSGVYYTRHDGVIGFYYPSGEEWYLKR